MAFEHLLSVSAACAVERLATGSGVLTTRRESKPLWPGGCHRRQGIFSGERNMELVIGVIVWVVLAGGLLALFSDDGRG
jgi:hypothetical protein